MFEIPYECLHRIRVMLEATGETANDELISVYYELMAEQIANYIGEERVPKKLIWLLREVTIRRYNLTGQEHTVQDTVGSTSSTYRIDVLEQYYKDLDEYIAHRDSARRVRFY